jgi:isopenicillin N synthase-like dioxygenase
MSEETARSQPTPESYYGRAIPQSLAARAVDFTELAVIDLGPLSGTDPGARRETVESLRRACIDVGFFYIRNHGVPATLVEHTFATVREFFALPLEEKNRILKSKTTGFGGYSPMLDLDYGDPARASLAEAFHMNLELPPDDPWRLEDRTFYNANVWPERPAGFREVLIRYHDAMRCLGDTLFEAFALAAGVAPEFFKLRSRKPIALMRVNHYPPQRVADDPRRLGAAPHTDYECFTLLAQEDHVCALEVVNGKGEWISVPPIPGTFVVNIADQMARWTNDLFRSTMHRVINRNDVDRCSIAHFQGVNSDTLIEVLPSCVPAGERPKYPPITAHDYVTGRVAVVFGYALTEAPAA